MTGSPFAPIVTLPEAARSAAPAAQRLVAPGADGVASPRVLAAGLPATGHR
jgi:hypothetical protein